MMRLIAEDAVNKIGVIIVSNTRNKVKYLRKYSIKTSNYKKGDILAEDIIIDGVKLVSKNTTLNNYITQKLSINGFLEIKVYRGNGQANEGYSNQEAKSKKIKETYDKSIFDIKKLINTISKNDEMNYEAITSLSDVILDLASYGSDVIKYLNSLKRVDEYTYTHCLNVALYASMIGHWMGLSNGELKDIVQAGVLHDIGKIRIEESILNKADKLTNSEFCEIKNHTIYGYDIVNDSSDITYGVKQGILMHHERMDGSGYPFGLNSSEIHFYAKLVSVADVFDAMISNRVYKKGVSPFKAFELFLTGGLKLFDTSIIFNMIENISAYYIGMDVLFDDGQIGEIVYIPPKNVLNPIIRTRDKLVDFSKDNISRIVKII